MVVRKKSYTEIELDDDISMLKYIGPHILRRLHNVDIYTADDLLETFHEMVDNRFQRKDISVWLRNVTTNARPNQCTRENPRIVQNSLNGYLIRDSNFYGYNTILAFWRHQLTRDRDRKAFIPRRFTGRTSLKRSHPNKCRV